MGMWGWVGYQEADEGGGGRGDYAGEDREGLVCVVAAGLVSG